MNAAYQHDHYVARGRGLLCERGGRILFAGLDFSVAPGQSLLVRGPNGAGKSSLIRLIAGLLPHAGGTLDIEGNRALCDENLALDDRLTLSHALLFWAQLDGRGIADVSAALDLFALGGLADVPVHMLSTGQRKRAMLARVAASGATLWLLDEPCNGLDTASLELLGKAVNAHLDRGGAAISASHSPLPYRAEAEIILTPPRRDALEAIW